MNSAFGTKTLATFLENEGKDTYTAGYLSQTNAHILSLEPFSSEILKRTGRFVVNGYFGDYDFFDVMVSHYQVNLMRMDDGNTVMTSYKGSNQFKAENFSDLENIIGELVANLVSVLNFIELFLEESNLKKGYPVEHTDLGISELSMLGPNFKFDESLGVKENIHLFIEENIHKLGSIVNLINYCRKVCKNFAEPDDLSGLMHDIATPMSSIKLKQFLLVKHRQTFSGKLFEDHGVMVDALTLCTELLAQMIKMDIHKPDTLDNILNSVVRPFRRFGEFNLQISDTFTSLNIPKKRVLPIKRMVLNLLSNAVKYTYHDDVLNLKGINETPILLESQIDRNGNIILIVEDPGLGGLTPGDRKPFLKGVKLHGFGDEFPSSGLGLHSVATLVSEYSGSVDIIDPREGYNTAFQILLPSSFYRNLD